MLDVAIHAAVMLFFFNLYRNRPAVVSSPGGLITKAVQLVLEGILIYLIVVGWQKRVRIDQEAMFKGEPMKFVLLALFAVAGLLLVGWLGLQFKPRPFAPYPEKAPQLKRSRSRQGCRLP